MKPLTPKWGLGLTDKLTQFWLLSITFVTVVTIIFMVAVSHLTVKPLSVVTPTGLISSEDVSCFTFSDQI
jgi:hypothetical protein